MNKKQALTFLRGLEEANTEHTRMIGTDEVKVFGLSMSLSLLIVEARIKESTDKQFRRADILAVLDRLTDLGTMIAEELLKIFKGSPDPPTKEQVLAALDKIKHEATGGMMQ